MPHKRMSLSRILLDSIPSVAFLLKPETREIIVSNEEASKRGAVPGKQCFATWGQRDDPCPWCLAPTAWETGKAQNREVETLGIVWNVHWIPINRDLYLHFAFDITERKRAEKALQQSEARYRAVVEQSPDGIYLIDVETKRVFEVNRAFAQMMGYTSEEILELSIYDIVAADREDVEQKFEEIVQKEALFYERQIRRKDGSILDVWISAGVISYEGRKVVCVVHDITERKRAEERICIYQNQLRSLASELSLAEERERRRIASELHDHIGQTLAICKIKLGALQELASSTDLTGFCNEIRELIEQMIRYTRSLTADLSPPVLYELGLEAALEWLTERIREQHGILVEFMDDGEDKPMNDEIRVLLFKAVRELLVNVVKHAHPAKAKVSIQRNRGHLRITVQDDGVGFNTLETNSNLGNNGGFGLFSIRERLGHLGGHVEVESERGFGTRVSLVMPLTRNKDKAK